MRGSLLSPLPQNRQLPQPHSASTVTRKQTKVTQKWRGSLLSLLPQNRQLPQPRSASTVTRKQTKVTQKWRGYLLSLLPQPRSASTVTRIKPRMNRKSREFQLLTQNRLHPPHSTSTATSLRKMQNCFCRLKLNKAR